MKQFILTKFNFNWVKRIYFLSSLLFLLPQGDAQIQVIIPNDSIGSDLINARTLASLISLSWNSYLEHGTDGFLNMFITNGQAVAVVV